MRPISEATAKVTKNTFGQKYVALGRVVSHWQEIVGTELADKAQPNALRYRKRKDTLKKPDAILEISTSSAYATRLHYQKDLILERINRIFGERWITDIKFVAHSDNTAKAPVKRRKKALSETEKNYIHESLDSITDKDVKERLESLGRSIILDSK